jgi:hypothetical protein
MTSRLKSVAAFRLETFLLGSREHLYVGRESATDDRVDAVVTDLHLDAPDVPSTTSSVIVPVRRDRNVTGIDLVKNGSPHWTISATG